MEPSYSQTQQVYCLNTISNSAMMTHGTVAELEALAASKITAVLRNPGIQQLIGPWTMVWGPVVYQHTYSTVADNTMYVAKRTDGASPEYVVGIAGTNPNSWYGWIVEDATLSPMVPWPYAPSGDKQPKLTQGTSIGLNILLGMSSNGKTLQQFLTEAVASTSGSLEVWFSGHSLGGALSPTIALNFADTQGKVGGWDPDSRAKVSALPTAGPTPGDQNFSQYYGQRLGSATQRFWNKIDVVPHGWQLMMLAEVPWLYDPNIAPTVAIKAIAAIAAANSVHAAHNGGAPLVQLLPKTIPLPGQYHPDVNMLLAQLNPEEINKLIEKIGAHLGLDSAHIQAAQALLDKALPNLKVVKATKVLSGATSMLAGFAHSVAGAAASVDQNLSHLKLFGVLKHLDEDAGEILYDALPVLQGGTMLELVKGLLEFLLQAVYQHTTAYPILMKTEAFAKLVDQING